MLALYEALTDSIESEEGHTAEFELKVAALKEKAKSNKQKQHRERRKFQEHLAAERVVRFWSRTLSVQLEHAWSAWRHRVNERFGSSLPRVVLWAMQTQIAGRVRTAFHNLQEHTAGQRVQLEKMSLALALEEESSRINFIQEEASVSTCTIYIAIADCVVTV